MTVLSTLNSATRSQSRSRSRSRSRSNKEMNMETYSHDVSSASTKHPNDLKECTSSFSTRSSNNSVILTASKPYTSTTSSYLDIVRSKRECDTRNSNDECDAADDDDGDDDDDVYIDNNLNSIEGHRSFHFAIENDANLRVIIDNEVDVNVLNMNVASDLTSDYIVSKLYNYMKISEMSSYGITVFELTFSSYLPYLNECDVVKLSISYWCNGSHFSCMMSHRGAVLMDECILRLRITDSLLDCAMQSGACVDKIDAMLKQRRMDENIQLFCLPKYERNFYLRNLHHRLWNHEVLVRTFIQNGWLTSNLAHHAMKSFICKIYYRLLHQAMHAHQTSGNNNNNSFLHSFFVSHFCLDNIPAMYRQRQRAQMRINTSDEEDEYVMNEEILRRWCELVELLASRGAKVSDNQFKRVIPLQYAYNLGRNTYRIVSYSYKNKNKLLIPDSYRIEENIVIPNDVWDITVSYL